MAISVLSGAPSSAGPRIQSDVASVTLGEYLSTVVGAVRAGLPARSWVEATVAAAKPGNYGHSLQLIDPAGGASAPSMRAFLRTSDRQAMADRLGTELDPAHLVGLTVVLLVAPEFHPRWGMGGCVVGLAQNIRESLIRRVLEEVRTRLKTEQLYDRQRRLPTPGDMVRVAAIHPAGAAGYGDIAGELARWERAGIAVVGSITVPFEGPRAAAEIAEAIRRASSGNSIPPDAILIVRGGGDRAGLAALDDEAVARAVSLCVVPIITGLGHSCDLSLTDEVAWTACHTPSKALACLAALISAPARRARADMAATMAEAERCLVVAGHGVDAARQAAASGAERRLHAAASLLAALRRDMEAGASGAGERCARLSAEADALIQAVLERAPARLDAAERLAQRIADDVSAAGRHRLGQADDGSALWSSVLDRATARLDAAGLDTRRRIEAVPLDAARRLTDAGLDLTRIAGLVEGLSFQSTLRRGFALVTMADGTLVPTRAAALAAGDLSLRFVDGTVSARIGTILPTTQLTGEAA